MPGRIRVIGGPPDGGHSAPGADFGDHEDPRIGVGKPLAVVLFAAFAVYAALLALVARGAESAWGVWASGAYGAAALTAAWCWRKCPTVPLLVASVGALVVPATLLPANWGATSEVRVVARAATLWLAHGTPYLATTQLASWRSYDPYLPGMSLFGLPHAIGLPGPLGEPRLWLAIATVGAVAAACHIAAPCAAQRGKRGHHQTLLRTSLLISCPVFALPMTLGVTDPPVIALMCLSLAWAARSTRSPLTLAESTPRGPAGGSFGPGFAPQRRGHPLLAGAAIGVGCALKATAWPALPVVAALVAIRDGRRAAVRFASASLGSCLLLIAVTAPALLDRPRALWQNIVAYPLGMSRRPTQAASPLPGHLIAGTGSLGHLVAILLLAGAALVVGASLVLRPPRDVRQASVRLAVSLAVVFLLAPDARFGYFAYPLGILCWLMLTVANPRVGSERPSLDLSLLNGVAAALPQPFSGL